MPPRDSCRRISYREPNKTHTVCQAKGRVHAGLFRLCEGLEERQAPFSGIVEADETYIGGSDRNRHYDKKGTAKKAPGVGIKERESNRVHAVVMPNVNKFDVQYWLHKHVSAGAKLFTDEAGVYVGADVAEHRSVNHSKKQYVSGETYTNGVESHWALLKRGYHGTYHWWSVKHMQRHVEEFSGRFNLRDLPTCPQCSS